MPLTTCNHEVNHVRRVALDSRSGYPHLARCTAICSGGTRGSSSVGRRRARWFPRRRQDYAPPRFDRTDARTTDGRTRAGQLRRSCAGEYTLSVTSPGFRNLERRLTVGADRPKPLKLQLQIDVSEVVNVSERKHPPPHRMDENADAVPVEGDVLAGVPMADAVSFALEWSLESSSVVVVQPAFRLGGGRKQRNDRSAGCSHVHPDVHFVYVAEVFDR